MWCDFKNKIKKEIYLVVAPTQNSIKTAGAVKNRFTSNKRKIKKKNKVSKYSN